MQDDCISVALGLPQLRILKQKELENYVILGGGRVVTTL